MNLREMFIEYITEYSFGKPRTTPANPRTIGRQHRGLKLVEKLVGKSLNDITDEDQLVYMERIMTYSQGTRIVTTTIFQRFLWWAITNDYLRCQNLIKGNEAEIRGENTPVRYASMNSKDIQHFLRKLTDRKQYLVFHFVFFTGADSSDLTQLKVSDVKENYVRLQRQKLGRAQMITLPDWFGKELYEYVQGLGHDGHVFFTPDTDTTEQRDREIDALWKQACLNTGMFHHTTFKDFRVNVIKIYAYQESDDESIREFAGVPEGKKGWLLDLMTDNEVYLKEAMEGRTKNGKVYIER